MASRRICCARFPERGSRPGRWKLPSSWHWRCKAKTPCPNTSIVRTMAKNQDPRCGDSPDYRGDWLAKTPPRPQDGAAQLMVARRGVAQLGQQEVDPGRQLDRRCHLER